MIARNATAGRERGRRASVRPPMRRWARWPVLVVAGPLLWLLAQSGGLDWLVAAHHPVRTVLEGLSWPATVLALGLAIGAAARRRSTPPVHSTGAPGTSVVFAASEKVPAPMPSPSPRQLPPAPAQFTNRTADVQRLDEVMAAHTPPSTAVVVLTGLGGVGKTALALRWLHEHASRFPGGVLYAQLGARGPGGPATPTTVLAQFLRALGAAPGSIPLDLPAQTSLFHSMTAERAVAVLADDAVNAA
ncbi:ATP-binding protein [Saccharothrix sp. AJ9571]|nr:ATP-binding protein [Saccharothrix sp. AJ9571]